MTETSLANAKKASREATDWLIRLQEAPDDQDLLNRFDAWLDASPVNRTAWAATQRTARLIEETPPRSPAKNDLRSSDVPRPRGAARRSSGRRPTSRSMKTLRPAALVATLGLALAILAPDLWLRVHADHRTGTAEQRDLRFDDGTLVVLAPGSALTVAYSETERRIDLLAGEAFFDVAPDPTRPFQVTTEDLSARVLGTSFNLVVHGDGATVALKKGRLEVDNPSAPGQGRPAKLDAGDTLRLGKEGEIQRGHRAPALIAAWRQGQLVAEDQPMRQVVNRLGRYYAGQILLTDPELGRLPVTGVYTLTDPVEALRAIARAHGATVRQMTPWLLVVSRS